MNPKYVLAYRECAGKEYRSITMFEQKELPQDKKQKIIDYLLNKNFCEWRSYGTPEHSAFTGNVIPAWGWSFTDGDYLWSDDLAVYVEQNNIKLPTEFINHVMEFYESGGKTDPYSLKPPSSD